MKLTTSRKQGRSILRLQGDLRINAVAMMKEPLLAALDAGGGVGLDLAGVKSCDTAGVQLLLMVCAAARGKGVSVSVETASAAFELALSQNGVSPESLQGTPKAAGP